jgi:hypothetical protein
MRCECNSADGTRSLETPSATLSRHKLKVIHSRELFTYRARGRFQLPRGVPPRCMRQRHSFRAAGDWLVRGSKSVEEIKRHWRRAPSHNGTISRAMKPFLSYFCRSSAEGQHRATTQRVDQRRDAINALARTGTIPRQRKIPWTRSRSDRGPGLAFCNVQLSFKTAGTLTVPIIMAMCFATPLYFFLKFQVNRKL